MFIFYCRAKPSVHFFCSKKVFSFLRKCCWDHKKSIGQKQRNRIKFGKNGLKNLEQKFVRMRWMTQKTCFFFSKFGGSKIQQNNVFFQLRNTKKLLLPTIFIHKRNPFGHYENTTSLINKKQSIFLLCRRVSALFNEKKRRKLLMQFVAYI